MSEIHSNMFTEITIEYIQSLHSHCGLYANTAYANLIIITHLKGILTFYFSEESVFVFPCYFIYQSCVT